MRASSNEIGRVYTRRRPFQRHVAGVCLAVASVFPMAFAREPSNRGLYDPSREQDACGVGCIADLQGRYTRRTVSDAYKLLVRMTHRGAKQGEDGDGAGIMLGLPHAFYRKVTQFSFHLPPQGRYGVGMFFLPKGEMDRHAAMEMIERTVRQHGLVVLGWRAPLPTKSTILGPKAKATEPFIAQVFVSMPTDLVDCEEDEASPMSREVMPRLSKQFTDNESDAVSVRETVAVIEGLPADLETLLYIVRKKLAKEQTIYICSFSSRTVVYKGQFQAEQLFNYFDDLMDEDLTSYLALVHSRFSTNTFPNWQRAHPFRRICHNGEINTIEGNRNWLRAREGLMKATPKAFASVPLADLVPIDEGCGSDSSTLDSVVDFLTMAGRPIEHVIMMLVPEAWQNNSSMTEEKRAFYQYHSCMMEPWDGPALVAFTDGKKLGATLDRNGLRPGRYYITVDDRLILGSEVGVVDVASSQIRFKGRLRPGRMLLIDFQQKRLVEDEALKASISRMHPYAEWVKKNTVRLADLTQPVLGDDLKAELMLDDKKMIRRMKMFGYSYEKFDMLVAPMAKRSAESLGSMGNDIPLACLSKLPRNPADYFAQMFAQATNPAIDPIREANVMSLECPIGPEQDLLKETPQHCNRIVLEEPVLDPGRFRALVSLEGFPAHRIDITWDSRDGPAWMETRMKEVCREASDAVSSGKAIIVLSDRRFNESRVPIFASLIVGAVHQHLIQQKLRSDCALVIETGDAFEVHQICVLLGFGADAIYPYMAYHSLSRVRFSQNEPKMELAKMIENYRVAVHAGVLKVMSKFGISTLMSYKGAGMFQAVGLSQKVIDTCFTGCASVIGGVGLDVFAVDALRLHNQAFPRRELPPLVDMDVEEFDEDGVYHFRSIHDTELHMNHPDSIAKVQDAARRNSRESYREFSDFQNALVDRCELRGSFELALDKCTPIAIEEVESVAAIVKRFATGAMSYGSISEEAHKALAIAMNRIGGRSNTGEGGESDDRYLPGANGENKRSAIKQIASGRFGVTSQYLVNADELQIKLAQGAKPGEGGELPGHKVVGKIAETRKSTPGVGLISPPPHHDMYSIEDVAQLISDLKNANPEARVSVKLVSKVGVGIIAAGIVKGKTDHLLISGMSGGTGAAKWTSIKHAGLPWEIGLAETHQTLVLNGLREKVILQTDGQIKTGRDVVYAALLGAEEVCFSTQPLIALGCIMMRKCHLNTCPVGIATQDEELRKKFTGKPEHVLNYLFLVGEEVRAIMAQLGIRKYDDMVGRADLLRPKPSLKEHYKTREIDLSKLLYPAWQLTDAQQPSGGPQSLAQSVPPGMCCRMAQDHELDKVIDREIVRLSVRSLQKQAKTVLHMPVRNVDRTVGGILSYEVTRRYGAQGMPPGTIVVRFRGSAGQSFGAWLAPGITFDLQGDANDYTGKGLSGGHVVVRPPKDSPFFNESHGNIIVGNACLYGATDGRAFFAGVAAERFAVRNSGAIAVVEGVGDHGCEYMTRGLVVILGEIGQNFAAGMSGGIAYLLDIDKDNVNDQMVYLEPVTSLEDKRTLENLVNEHYDRTRSERAKLIINNWKEYSQRFTKVFPKDYKRVLREAIADHVRTGSKVAGAILNDWESIAYQLNMRAINRKMAVPFRALLNEQTQQRYRQWLNKNLKNDSTFQEIAGVASGNSMLRMIKDDTSTAAMTGKEEVLVPRAQSTLKSGKSAEFDEREEELFQMAFRAQYMMWRKGHHRGTLQLMGSNVLDNKVASRLFKTATKEMLKRRISQEKQELERRLNDAMIPSAASAVPRAKTRPEEEIPEPQNGQGAMVEKAPVDGAREQLVSNFTAEDFVDSTPLTFNNEGMSMEKARQALDMEDLVSRPKSVAFPDKKKGFHKYEKEAHPYREPKVRVLDWEEITVPTNSRSRLYDQLLRTQAARCMDCGTPTCHYPNPQGGGCPLGNRIPTWNALTYEGNWKQALERLLDTNNFPEFTGRICPAPCEESCVLGINEKSVAIKSIEVAIIDYAFSKGWIKPRPPKVRTYKQVAIIGSGPAGLAAAQQLNRAGHSVTVFERSDRVGGLLMYGIPNMKLDKTKIVQRRVDLLQAEGITFHTSVEIGKDKTLEELREEFDAVLLATGATASREFKINGWELEGIHQAMDFLHMSQKSLLDSDMQDSDYIDAQDKHVIVIGGGDTAVDCLGTAIRMGAASVLQFSRREEAPKNRPDNNPWPQWGEFFRVDYGHAECHVMQGRDPREYCVKGVEFVPHDRDPTRVGGIKAIRMHWQKDPKTGRARMEAMPGTEKVYKADIVLLAMGFLGPEATTWSGTTVNVDKRTSNIDAAMGDFRTNVPGVFACGDCRRGATLVVWAIAEGRDAAHKIDEYLMGDSVLPRAFPESANPKLFPPTVSNPNPAMGMPSFRGGTHTGSGW
ncbi:unnamed protein product [Vitrella brassicaformis CCMP3155]|uniref:glutamate synthase (NADH) n=3 Tax=Vitrella brassicaformis TaxID=1169539 RepID=A0A0G4FTT1_VITBC|nr:unnamed protein product [Vitrella brassicaformis CCMP3155]|eukprot:CEM18299.1 unnamed protein product [Vitrella brassicaformis CCMP3155]